MGAHHVGSRVRDWDRVPDGQLGGPRVMADEGVGPCDL